MRRFDGKCDRIFSTAKGRRAENAAVRHERLRGLTGLLATRDAQGLYEQFEFTTVDGRLYMRKPAGEPQSEPAEQR